MQVMLARAHIGEEGLRRRDRDGGGLREAACVSWHDDVCCKNLLCDGNLVTRTVVFLWRAFVERTQKEKWEEPLF
eukprot:1953346-Prorocentrum_lima.AAC.1